MTEAKASPAGNSTRPLASVVVNNFNYGRFLADALDSALAQTYQPLEVVVVDDGSTDDSRLVIQSYAGRVVAVLQENGGMAAAINAGFFASSGDVVLFLDSDDSLVPDAVANAAKLLQDSNVAKVHWPMSEMLADGTLTGRLVPKQMLPEGDLRDIVIRAGPMAGNGSPTSGNAWARWFLDEVLPIPENELKQHADAYLNTLACLAGEVRLVSEPQSRYRVHGNNDYATQPMLDRLRRNLQMYHYRCRLLSARLRATGTSVHPVSWKSENPSHYAHLVRRLATMQTIADLIPAGGTFVIVDDGAFGTGTLVGGRSSVRFGESSGVTFAMPETTAEFIHQLHQLHSDGAQFLVFVAPALGWLTRLDGLRSELDSTFPCEISTEFVVAFNLRA